MPQFKIRRIDGGEQVVTARRVVTEGDTTIFHELGPNSLQVVHQLPSAHIESLQRRIVEPSGTTRWITERLTAATTSRRSS